MTSSQSDLIVICTLNTLKYQVTVLQKADKGAINLEVELYITQQPGPNK